MENSHNKSGAVQGESSLFVETPIYAFMPRKFKTGGLKGAHMVLTLTSDNSVNISSSHDSIGPYSPKPRSGHRIVCDDVNVYSFGGYNPDLGNNDTVWSANKPLFKELWKYNISTATWKKLDVGMIPDMLASNAVLLSGSVLMVYGGTGVPFGANCSNDLYICDFRSYRDKPIFVRISTAGNSPQPQYGQAILLLNGHLYTVGGTTGYEYTCDIHRLNLRTCIWEAVYTCKGAENEPAGRYRHEIVFYDDRIYVLGGGTAQEAFGFQVVFAFDLTINRWEKINTKPDNKAREAFPAPRRCHSCVQDGADAYIIGGFTGRFMLKDIWRLNLETYEWKRFPGFSLDLGVYFHSSCLTSTGKLITFGGIVQTEISSKRSAAVHTAWIGIPKLKDICWDALMFYFWDEWKLLSVDKLHSLGLPLDYIKRLEL